MTQMRAMLRRGFTLIELLVAMVLMSLVIIATFAFMSSMSGVFYSQDMIVDAQSSARFALDFVSMDVRRAGYLATPSAAADNLVCPKPTTINVPVRAIDIEDGATRSLDNNQVFGTGAPHFNRNIEPDRLVLMGSFDAPDMFKLDGVNASTARLNPQSAARVLGNGTPQENEAAFANIFIAGRVVRVSDVDGTAQFGVINSANFGGGTPTVNISGLVVNSGSLACGLQGVSGQSYELAVLNIYEYRVINRGDGTVEPEMDLIRTELRASGAPLTLPGGGVNQVPVAEYVVDFQVLAFGDRAGGLTPVMAADQQGDDQGSLDIAFLDRTPDSLANWQRIREMQIVLSVRTPREDPNMSHIQRQAENGARGTNYGLLATFDMDGDPFTAAHVVTLSTRVEVPNLTFANVR